MWKNKILTHIAHIWSVRNFFKKRKKYREMWNNGKVLLTLFQIFSKSYLVVNTYCIRIKIFHQCTSIFTCIYEYTFAKRGFYKCCNEHQIGQALQSGRRGTDTLARLRILQKQKHVRTQMVYIISISIEVDLEHYIQKILFIHIRKQIDHLNS